MYYFWAFWCDIKEFFIFKVIYMNACQYQLPKVIFLKVTFKKTVKMWWNFEFLHFLQNFSCPGLVWLEKDKLKFYQYPKHRKKSNFLAQIANISHFLQCLSLVEEDKTNGYPKRSTANVYPFLELNLLYFS